MERVFYFFSFLCSSFNDQILNRAEPAKMPKTSEIATPNQNASGTIEGTLNIGHPFFLIGRPGCLIVTPGEVTGLLPL